MNQKKKKILKTPNTYIKTYDYLSTRLGKPCALCQSPSQISHSCQTCLVPNLSLLYIQELSGAAVNRSSRCIEALRNGLLQHGAFISSIPLLQNNGRPQGLLFRSVSDYKGDLTTVFLLFHYSKTVVS